MRINRLHKNSRKFDDIIVAKFIFATADSESYKKTQVNRTRNESQELGERLWRIAKARRA